MFFVFIATSAQIPYFSGTVGNNKLYGYTSLKFRPGINAQETYTTFQFGLGDSFATGIDLSTTKGVSYAGVLLRYGKQISPYFGIGGQITPSFDLNDNMSFKYATAALYMNAARYGKNALAICTISDHVLTGEGLSAQDRQASFTQMMEVALETACVLDRERS